ncbi:MAG: M56 family metallopeptidase [Candidatus Sulfobium sp.]
MDSYIGKYIVQSVFHSLVALLMVEMSLRIWQTESASERFMYRLQVIILPFIMYPVFQLINPARGSLYFVEDSAFFSSMRWLRLDLFGQVPFYFLFLAVLLAVSVLVVVQEVVPVVKHSLDKNGEFPGTPASPEVKGMVEEMSTAMNIDNPSVFLLDKTTPVIYTTGTKSHSIVISRGLVRVFDERQLRSALAHELAHIVRRSNITTLLVFLVRICMFYNPVSLLEFRRIVQDDEHICDDITISVTRDPKALAAALKVFYAGPGRKSGGGEHVSVSALSDSIERSSHDLLLKERIARLENSDNLEYQQPGWGRYLLTLGAIVVVNYYVV